MLNKFKQLKASKKEYREYKQRVEQLPEEFKTPMKALEHYLYNYAKGDGIMKIIYSILDMFEMAVENHQGIHDVVGEDIADFADNLLREYPEETWVNSQRDKLRKSIK
ncbi:DUF1048 domain-containing protein [Paucilactobacillus kaifaensis]|uniref:DUF1048 domain-containing protein n=1 Tax=Paucilactobacillus kaifaensis TaxID=2559921 RepID=UPI0010F6308C|nr:DUF1048 domain-containing protein [Paucilactobacillus kaifaensis]